MLDRDLGQIRAKVVPNVSRKTLQDEVLKNVKYGSTVYSDNAVAYDLLHLRYVHDVVDHAKEYVKGRVHTNGRSFALLPTIGQCLGRSLGPLVKARAFGMTQPWGKNHEAALISSGWPGSRRARLTRLTSSLRAIFCRRSASGPSAFNSF
jgi:hypothetical protein